MEATPAAGLENFGVLVRLKVSALNSVFTFSVTLNVRKRLRFRFHSPGPNNVLRPVVPKRMPVGCWNASGSNQDLFAPISPRIATLPGLTWSAVWELPGAFNSVPEAETVRGVPVRSEEHTSELQSQFHLVCRLLLEKKKKNKR